MQFENILNEISNIKETKDADILKENEKLK